MFKHTVTLTSGHCSPTMDNTERTNPLSYICARIPCSLNSEDSKGVKMNFCATPISNGLTLFVEHIGHVEASTLDIEPFCQYLLRKRRDGREGGKDGREGRTGGKDGREGRIGEGEGRKDGREGRTGGKDGREGRIGEGEGRKDGREGRTGGKDGREGREGGKDRRGGGKEGREREEREGGKKGQRDGRKGGGGGK